MGPSFHGQRHRTSVTTIVLVNAYSWIVVRWTASVDPLTGNFQTASEAIGSKGKINRAAQFIRDKIANDLRSITGPSWDLDKGSACFPPLDAKPSIRTITFPVPPDGNAPLICRKCPVLDSVGRQLMQHH